MVKLFLKNEEINKFFATQNKRGRIVLNPPREALTICPYIS